MRIECAELSLIGGREENQDRVLLARGDGAVLGVVIDGMGGHADGAKAAELASRILGERFKALPHPVFDPQGFLHLSIGQAHREMVEMGNELSVEVRPRATCVAMLVQDGGVFWGHVGDSRIYLVRDGEIIDRTRDHSHVELLLQEGLITEEEILDHPMRNFVECCLGGDVVLPGMNITSAKRLQPGDTLLACSDGFWSGLTDEQIGSIGQANGKLDEHLRKLGELAVEEFRSVRRQYLCRRLALERLRSPPANKKYKPTKRTNNMTTQRPSRRSGDELRAVQFEPGYTIHAAGSVLAVFGATRVLCTASVRRLGATIPAWPGTGLDYGRIRHVARFHAQPIFAGSGPRQAIRSYPGNPAPDRPFAAGRL